MNELNKKSDESHNGESDCSGYDNLLIFPFIWFGASLDKTDGIFCELTSGFNKEIDLIHDGMRFLTN